MTRGDQARPRVWELEARDKDGEIDFDRWSKTQLDRLKLAEIRDEYELVAEIKVQHFLSFDELIEEMGSKAATRHKSSSNPMGYAVINGVNVRWIGYHCEACRTSFLVPWELVDKLPVVGRGKVITVSKSSDIQRLFNRLQCCPIPSPKVTITQSKESPGKFTASMLPPRSGDYVLWTIPFELMSKFTKLDEAGDIDIPQHIRPRQRVPDVLSYQVFPYIAIAFCLGVLIGTMLF